MSRLQRTILIAGLLLLLQQFAPVRTVLADEVAAVTELQQDPKRKEIKTIESRWIASEMIILAADFPEDGLAVRVELFNLLGRLIEQHPIRTAVKGTNVFQFKTKGLPNGPYIVVLESAGQRLIYKIMVSR